MILFWHIYQLFSLIYLFMCHEDNMQCHIIEDRGNRGNVKMKTINGFKNPYRQVGLVLHCSTDCMSEIYLTYAWAVLTKKFSCFLHYLWVVIRLFGLYYTALFRLERFFFQKRLACLLSQVRQFYNYTSWLLFFWCGAAFVHLPLWKAYWHNIN